MMTEPEAMTLGQSIADDLPQAQEVSVILDQWTGGYGVYVHLQTHEALILEPDEWPTLVLSQWLEEA